MASLNGKDILSSSEEASTLTGGASGGSSSLRIPQSEEEFSECLREELERRYEFNQIVVGYIAKKKGEARTLQELMENLKDADSLLHDLLVECRELSIVDLREKDGPGPRDSGIESSEDSRRNAVRISHTDSAFPEIGRNSSVPSDLQALHGERNAVENTDVHSDN